MNTEQDLDIHVSLNGRNYYIRRSGANGWLRVTGTRQQYDLTNKFPIAQYTDQPISIDPYGRLGQKILKAGGVKI